MDESWFQSLIESSDSNLEDIAISKILISKKLTPDLLPEYFTGQREKLYRAIEKQWTEQKCIDPILLKITHYDAVVSAIKESGSSSPAIIEQLQDLWKRRELAKIIHNCASIDSIDDILAKLQQETGQIALKNSQESYDHTKEVGRLLEVLERAQKQSAKIAGYSTGIIEMDKFLSGIEPGKMYCIGALKKSGKSRFAVFLSIMMKHGGAGVLWNSLEMNSTQLNSCALAYYSGIDSRNFGRVIPMREYQLLGNGFSGLSELKWLICREKTVQNLRARIMHERNRQKIDVVIIDFIQRMTDQSKESRTKEVEAISMQLADLSRELNIAVVCLSQLAGVAENLKDDEMPNMSHMKESQGIAENADAILTLHNFDRRKNPFNDDGSYRLQEIHCLIEQRYDVSGCCFKFLGDMRNCQFHNHDQPYGGKDE